MVKQIELYNELSDVTMSDLGTVVNLTRFLEEDSVATYVRDKVYNRTVEKFPDRVATILGSTGSGGPGDVVIGSFNNDLMSAIRRGRRTK